MAKNLYIYTLDNKCNFHKKIWEDVKITRDERKIVTKKNADYRLTMGNCEYEENLDKIQTFSTGYPTSIINHTKYITFNEEEITDDIKTQLAVPFINEYSEERKRLQKQIYELDSLIIKFLHVKEEI